MMIMMMKVIRIRRIILTVRLITMRTNIIMIVIDPINKEKIDNDDYECGDVDNKIQ